jgi:hypothetical protein
MGNALIADATGFAFVVLVLTSIGAGFAWLNSFVDTLSFRKTWKEAAATAVLVVFAGFVNEQNTKYRELSQYDPGEATFTIVFGFFWICLAGFFLVGPFVLLFSSSKKNERGNP